MERTLSPARAGALVLIALAALGLAYAKLGAGARHVTVPAGARAGQLTLHACHYRGLPADCGTLVVPENRAKAHTRLIALPVIRVRARSAHPGTPVFRLEGGPGQSNFDFPAVRWLAPRHDVVLVGYRGVEGSSVLSCPEVVSALEHSADLIAPAATRAYTDAFRDCARRLQAAGVDLGGYSMAARTDDLEAARVALGYPRIDLVSESAGTRTALIYAWRHPASIERSVMVGANPPGRFLWDPATTDAQIARYGRLCARDATCRARTGDLAATMRTRIPRHWGPLPIEPGNVRLATFFGLTESTKAASPLSAPSTFDTWISGAKGDASGFWLLSLMARLTLPDADVWGDAASIARADAAASVRHFSRHRHSILGDPFTRFLWGGGGLMQAWPANHADDPYSRMRDSQVPTLIISGTNDFATPPQFATRELLPRLPNGRQVLVGELGHTTDFWHYAPRAGAHLIGTFLDTGRVDASRYPHRAMDFRPPVHHTTLAKELVGALLALGALAVAALAWLGRRRRRLGPVAGAFVRSVAAIVLGLGGWSLATLAALIVAPALPLDDALLAMLSVGVPIGLGTGWAARAPLPAAIGGALLGASLGFGVTAGLPAVIATAIGAAAGANLGVIAFEMLAARRPVRT